MRLETPGPWFPRESHLAPISSPSVAMENEVPQSIDQPTNQVLPLGKVLKGVEERSSMKKKQG